MRCIGTLLRAASVTAIVMGVSGQALAQDTTESQQEEGGSQTATPPPSSSGAIVVTGIRGALDNAVNVKRDATTIGDAISADDIGTLPALDLAEALQVIPGVQVNRENDDGAFRYGEVSLRGLPGSFTNTTANGQSFAAPSGSVTPSDGVPNAFGAFSSRIFDGVWVNKSSRADLVEGGIAGTVDKRLAKALSKPDGQYVVNVTGQYEELPDDIVGSFFAAGTTHLIEDRLAITFKAAYEQESFRRDAFNFTTYTPLRTDGTRNRGGFFDPNGGTFEEWRAANGIADADTVLYPSAVRQYSEGREGHRFSFHTNIEFQATPNLKLGADVLYSDRELDLDAQWLLFQANGITTSITPTADPFVGYQDENGNNVWVVPGYDYLDVTYAQSPRGGTLTQDTSGFFLTAEWESDGWLVNSSFAYSEAEFIRISTNYQTQYLSRSSNGHENNNGTFGSLNSGAGNSDAYLLTLDFDPAITARGTNLDLTYPSTNNPTATFIQVASPIGNNRFFSAGNEVFRDRDDVAFNLDIEKELDFGLLKSIKVGGRYNLQNIDSFILFSSIAGLNTEGLSNDLFVPAPGPDNFFGGNLPNGYFGSEWATADLAATEEILYGGGVNNPNNFPTSPFTGAIYRQEANGNLFRSDTRGQTETKIIALYGMANWEGDLLGMNVGGNVGVRYVDTRLKGEGFGTLNGVAVPTTAENRYEHFLPSINASFEIVPNLYLRLAYSEAINRPNPAGFTPSLFIVDNPGDGTNLGSVSVTLPGTDVEAYTSQNYDISLEWYNRRGSLISIAAYRKDVGSFIDTRLICPEDGGGLGYGTLTAVDLGGGITECRIDSDNREISIIETFNFDTTIRIEGLELAVQQDLSFLENPFLRGFGVQASIAFLDVSGEDPNGDPASVPRISDTSYNVAGYWENKKFSARLAYNWRSEYFLEGGLSITGAEDREVKARGQLDFIMRYNFTDDLILDFRAFNITDVLYEEFQSGNPMLNRQTAYDGRTFSLGATYKF